MLEHTGLKVSHLYIAPVKQKYGIIERENYNKPKSENPRQPECPPEKEKAIMDALRYYGRIGLHGHYDRRTKIFGVASSPV